MLDLLLEGGTIATSSAVYTADLGIEDGKIVVISNKTLKQQASKTIDITGKIVIPGIIDPHVHYKWAVSGVVDDAETASISAAYGGITCFLVHLGAARPGETFKDLPTHRKIETAGINVEESLKNLIEENQRHSVIDFGVHCILYPDESYLRQIPSVIKMGINSFKLMLGYHPFRGMLLDDRLILIALDIIASNGGIALAHCENGYILGYLEDKLVAEGKYTAENYLKARPNIAEAESISHLITLAEVTCCPLYVVHLTTQEGLNHVIEARSGGKHVWCEVTPSHLLLSNEDLLQQGVLAKTAPPLRSLDDVNALWLAIKQDFIDTIASDHGAFERDKQKLSVDFHKAPFGMPAMETMLPLFYSEGVLKRKISLCQMVKILSENTAKIFGLYPRKGVICIGADADLVVIDPDIEWVIKAEQLHSSANYTPYEGWKIKGKPVMSFLRGEALLKDGKLQKRPGYGKYVERPCPSFSLTQDGHFRFRNW